VRLGYVIQYVPDVAATVAFYEAAFGLERRFLHESGTYAEMETGATALAFASEALPEGGGVRFRRTRPDGEPPGAESASSRPGSRTPTSGRWGPARPRSRRPRRSRGAKWSLTCAI
jgi:lactoylglutathione lyase